MTAADLIAGFEQRLRALADFGKAVPMRSYLLDQFPFLGLPAPVRRAAVHELVRQPQAEAGTVLAIADALWSLPEREFRYTAIDLLRQHRRLLGVAHLPLLRQLLLREPWWETVDGLAGVIGAIVLRETKAGKDAQAVMDAWLADPSFWVRRAAMLHQLGWRLDTDEQRLAHYAITLAGEQEFFIRKAIGWALRDYARWNPDFVRKFINDQRGILSSLTVREAGRRLDQVAPR